MSYFKLMKKSKNIYIYIYFFFIKQNPKIQFTAEIA